MHILRETYDGTLCPLCFLLPELDNFAKIRYLLLCQTVHKLAEDYP